jgi:hypothetical protein
MKSIYILPILLLAMACKKSEAVKEANAKTKDSISALSEQLLDDDSEGQRLKFETSHTFDLYKAQIYSGTLAEPDFKGSPIAKPADVKLIKEGCEKGINFGGKYTIIHKSCGEMCELIFVVDRTNGKIYAETEPKNGSYGYLYKKDSRLLIANSSVFEDDSLTYYSDLFASPEVYLWEGDNFKFLQ